MSITRRDFVRTTVAGSVLAGLARAEEPTFPGFIERSHQPPNLEFPVSSLKEEIVANEQFFVRCHFPVPAVKAETWKLRVEGAIEKPMELTMDDVVKLPASKMTATLECAGNGRVYIVPSASGVQWSQGAASNAVWEGLSLADILDRAGVKKSAVEVILEGADAGQINSDPKTPGPIHFSRSLPMEKARGGQVLLAYKMNGETLPVPHGFPMRAVVGGWYGMASVKWLTRIIVTDKPYRGYFQTMNYAYFERRDGLPTLVPITAIQPKAILAKPGLNEVIPAGKPFRLFGAAWAGENAVKKVEVSLDGGKTWADAKLLGEPKPIQWVLWEYSWDNPTRGKASILVRATDDKGRTQPAKRDPDRLAYMINHLVPTTVTVH